MSNSDLYTISSEIIRSAIYAVIESELKSKDFVVEIESASKEGSDNFIGTVSRINFKKVVESQNETRSLIVKSAPDNIERREHFNVRPCFVREIFIYNEVLPYFHYFEQSTGITKRDASLTEYPKCFRAVDTEFNEFLLLEDLKDRGFVPIDRHTEKLNYHHIRLFLIAVAKYHAISLAVKDQQPEKFRSLAASTKVYMIDKNNESIRTYFNEQVQYALSLFSADEDALFREKLNHIFSKDALDIFFDLLDSGATETAAVISYGDANLNNTLFRYDNSKKPVEICLLDWQESLLGTPIADVVYYLFVSATKDVRDAHYNNLLREYHLQLSTHLRRLGSDPEKLFSFKLMAEHLRKYAKLAIMLAFMALPALTTDPDFCYFDEPAEVVATESEESSSVGYNNKFNQRMRDIITDIVNLGYI